MNPERRSDGVEPYRPLYAERRCLVCGYWRGQHIGATTDDPDMACPVDPSLVDYFQTPATFTPRP